MFGRDLLGADSLIYTFVMFIAWLGFAIFLIIKSEDINKYKIQFPKGLLIALYFGMLISVFFSMYFAFKPIELLLVGITTFIQGFIISCLCYSFNKKYAKKEIPLLGAVVTISLVVASVAFSLVLC